MSTDPGQRAVRLGVIGTGLAIDKLHWPALRQLRDEFEIVAFANHTRPKAEAFALTAGLDMRDYHADYADLLRRDDVEAVLISLPIPLLYPVSRDAMQAGKHVISEKPAGANIEQARQFVKLPTRFPNRTLLIAENFFYRDDLRLARSLLDQGAIGRVHLMQWRVVTQGVPKAGEFSSTLWRIVPEYRGGYFLDAAVHHTAQMRMLCGEVDEVHAYVSDVNATMGGPSDMVLNLRFANSALGSYTGGFLPIPTPEETNEMRLYGSDGILVIRMSPKRHLQLFRPDASPRTFTPPTDGGYINQLIDFRDGILTGGKVVGTVAQSYHNLNIIMRALDSAEAGRPVTMATGADEPRADGVPVWRRPGGDTLFDAATADV